MSYQEALAQFASRISETHEAQKAVDQAQSAFLQALIENPAIDELYRQYLQSVVTLSDAKEAQKAAKESLRKGLTAEIDALPPSSLYSIRNASTFSLSQTPDEAAQAIRTLFTMGLYDTVTFNSRGYTEVLRKLRLPGIEEKVEKTVTIAADGKWVSHGE